MARKLSSPDQGELPGLGSPALRSSKVAYVKSQRQTCKHGCHWPGCILQVPPAMWGCTRHWFRLPKNLRDRIWAAYRPGQERDLSPSDSYMDVAREVQLWIRLHGGPV